MSASLMDYSNQVADVVERASAAVAAVAARPGRPASGTVWAEGVVVASNHAVQVEEGITVSLGGEWRPAVMAGRDESTDIAVLRVEGLDAVPLARSEQTRVGALVVAIGRPGGLRASIGHLVATDSRQEGWRGSSDGLLLSDAHLYQGFSGGPLLDAGGSVLGVNSWFYGRGNTRTMASASVDRVVQSLLTHGRVKKPYLGIGTQPVALDAVAAEAAGQEHGLMIISVEAASPAAAAGLVQGDTLVAIDSGTVAGMRQLFKALQGMEVGSAHTLRVVRAGAVMEIQATVGERAEG